MKHKLKYINLFEQIELWDIPYTNDYKGLNVIFPNSIKTIDNIFNELTTEITGEILIQNTQLSYIKGFNKLEYLSGLNIGYNKDLISIEGFNNLKTNDYFLRIFENPKLTQVNGFNKLEHITKTLKIYKNFKLTLITGFSNLKQIKVGLSLEKNPKLIYLSIPHTIIKSVNYEDYDIEVDYYKHIFKSPRQYVNDFDIIQDYINKFDPGLHGDVVVTQIMENIETWGTPATQETIINHLLSKGNYWSLIPTNLQHLAEEHYKYLYSKKYKNTGARSVAKVATGVTYGLF